MTKYNERLDEVLERLYRIAADTELASDRFDPYYFNGVSEAKQALTSLIKELIEEAKPDAEDYLTAPASSIEEIYAYNKGIEKFEQNLLKALEEV